ncbi:MAG: helix-turn-helix transcriptional regulator [Deltaproteobacteria bacterium]|nr:helix-turn-helix transcriptional regulator [Deltaproteobacteria bacterium]
MNLKVILPALLRERGMTLSALAKKSGLNKSTLHGWTTGQVAINIDQLKKVATALEVSIHQLCFGEPDPNERLGEEVLKELFSGDLRVSIHKIERNRR